MFVYICIYAIIYICHICNISSLFLFRAVMLLFFLNKLCVSLLNLCYDLDIFSLFFEQFSKSLD